MQSYNFYDSFSNMLGDSLEHIGEVYELAWTSISFPLQLIQVMPEIIGISISIVVFVSVIKLIVGR